MQTTSASGKSKDVVRTSSDLHSVAKNHRCAFCLQFHEEINCQNVKDFRERKNIANRYGRCFICLAKGHLSCHAVFVRVDTIVPYVNMVMLILQRERMSERRTRILA